MQHTTQIKRKSSAPWLIFAALVFVIVIKYIWYLTNSGCLGICKPAFDGLPFASKWNTDELDNFTIEQQIDNGLFCFSSFSVVYFQTCQLWFKSNWGGLLNYQVLNYLNKMKGMNKWFLRFLFENDKTFPLARMVSP